MGAGREGEHRDDAVPSLRASPSAADLARELSVFPQDLILPHLAPLGSQKETNAAVPAQKQHANDSQSRTSNASPCRGFFIPRRPPPPSEVPEELPVPPVCAYMGQIVHRYIRGSFLDGACGETPGSCGAGEKRQEGKGCAAEEGEEQQQQQQQHCLLQDRTTQQREEQQRQQQQQHEEQRERDLPSSPPHTLSSPPPHTLSSPPFFVPCGRARSKLAVKQQASVLTWLSHGYNWLLRLNNVAFVLLIMAAPVLLALLFTPLFLALASGFAFPPDSPEFESLDIHTILSGPLAPPLDQWERASRAGPVAVALCWVCAAFVRAGQWLYVALHFFLFALSLCTTFGGSPLQVLSPSALILANALTLLAQLNFVFLSGAVFARIGRPAETVRCSRFVTIATQPLTGHGTEKRRILTARFALVGLNSHELVNVKLALSVRLFLPSPSGDVHCSLHDLELVKSELPYTRFCFNLRHIVDDTSPLHGLSLSDLLAADVSFSLTISGLERTSMQPVFVVKEYYAYDGEVLWDYEFLDLMRISSDLVPTIEHARLDAVTPLNTHS
ncbi:unnamed protein product [Closterium sp. Yama58-4]|nr:unnamed protein product [Closterium sp. Yama58-4]